MSQATKIDGFAILQTDLDQFDGDLVNFSFD